MRLIDSAVAKFSVVVLIAGSLFVTSAFEVGATNTGGSVCTKVGLTKKSGQTNLQCTKVGGKLLWVTAKSSTTSATTSATKIETTGCGSNSAGLFIASPFNASDISMITNGNETNDARFAYV